jgi:hypothetical protein
MARQSEDVIDKAGETITRGSGNVFAGLGDADAEERQTKLRVAHAINGVIVRRRPTQVTAADRLGIGQPTAWRSKAAAFLRAETHLEQHRCLRRRYQRCGARPSATTD